MERQRIAYVDEFDEDISAFLRYATDEFEVIPIKPMEDIEELIDTIISVKVEALIVDFDLTDKDPSIHYMGNEVIENFLKERHDFPVFVLTAYDERAIDDGKDVNIVYEKKLMFEKDPKFKEKVRKQIEKYKKKLKEAEVRLLQLQEKNKTEGLTYDEEQELIDLDDFIEKSLSKRNLTPKELKTLTNEKMLSEILEKADLMLKAISKNE